MRVLMTGNSDIVIYNFRLELVERLISEGYEVYALCPYGERIKELEKLGAIHHNITMDRHGVNPISELGLISSYRKKILEINVNKSMQGTLKRLIRDAIHLENELYGSV